MQLSTSCLSQDRLLVLSFFSTSLATDAVPVAIADDGSQRLPNASDGGTAADEPPTADLWSLHRGWDAEHEHVRLVTADFWGRISDGREHRGKEEEDSEGRSCANSVCETC